MLLIASKLTSHEIFGTKGESDQGLTPTKDGGTCLRRLSMFRKEVH